MKKPLLLKLFAAALLICLTLAVLTACGMINTEIRFIVDGEVYETITPSGQNSIKLPKEPKKEDCVFEGWFLDKDKCMQPFLGDLPENVQVVLEVYGKWSDTPCSHEWAISESTQPTCSSEGREMCSCTICGKNNETIIEKLEHNYVRGVCANKGCGAVDLNYYSDGLEFSLNDDGKSYSVAGVGTCTDTYITIPATFNSLPVTSIEREAFLYYMGAISITIPNTVTSIGEYAFTDCWSLVNINIPNGVTSIGEYAFADCMKLSNVIIPDSVVSIGSSAFSFCTSLTSITISDSVTSIGDHAFERCSGLTSAIIGNNVTGIENRLFSECSELTSVTIGNGVSSIANYAFERCSGLENIIVNEGNTKYHSENNCLIETESKTLILCCKNSIIPDNGSVVSIGNRAFNNCRNMTSITIPDSVTSIPNSAFSGCSELTSVTIGNGVTSIEYETFRYCPALTNVVLSNNLTSIGRHAFQGCTSLTNITIPDSVTSISDWAFSYCSSLKSLSIPKNLTSIGYWVFFGCNGLESITVAEGNTKYHSENNCLIEIESKTLLASCKSSAIPDDGSVIHIGDGVFYNCDLTSITIPKNIISIGLSAFENCKALAEIKFAGTIAEWNAIIKKNNWKSGVPVLTIICTDSEVAL